MLDRPCLLICTGIAVLGALAWLSIYLEVWAYSPESPRQYLVHGDETTTDWDMQVLAEEFIGLAGSDTLTAARSHLITDWSAVVIYRIREE